ncbi:MAG: type I-E CRISPR-associated protein Cas7/Cse4/CasC [Bifidobacteriaceae bacterium]|jgi:CRISPR system Cascade subunit CasC|nr:type I-E CRISPR-associated protein Cas7/Cse4/CasC [Bifidobacteriaceae bacterium]
MTQRRLYADLHIIQSLPPNNLNRDDTGSPKTAIYGGARRARVSSQAWKRAARVSFSGGQEPDLRAVRTRRLPELLAERLSARAGLTPELAARVSAILMDQVVKEKADKKRYLIFFGMPQLDAVVDAVTALNLPDDASQGDLREALSEVRLDDSLASGHPVDVALFGRMVADLAKINVDASAQVAHALSTHAVEIDFDYFTAVDDENPREDTGAGMIGMVEFNSATYDRYASVGVHQLADNLSGSWEAAVEALDSFVAAFTLSIPPGHQTSFAHRTRPALVAVVLREDQPVNLVSAFEAPVGGDRGVVAQSIARLVETFASERDRWGDRPVATFASIAAPFVDQPTLDAAEKAFGPNLAFADLRESLKAAVSGLS